MGLGLIAGQIGIGAVTGISQAISGAKQKREAREALENYQRQRLTNVADELSVYTKGAELQREEASRLAASGVDALQRADSRSLIGGLGNVQQNNMRINRQIGADLEQQQARIDQIRAQDSQRIQGMMERREQQDINALSSQYNAGNQQMWQGIGGVAQTGISGLQMIQEQKNMDDYMQKMYGKSGQRQTVQPMQSSILLQGNQAPMMQPSQPMQGNLMPSYLTPNRPIDNMLASLIPNYNASQSFSNTGNAPRATVMAGSLTGETFVE